MDKTYFEYSVRGDIALFTDPLSKIGGEKYSYPVPTYEAILGMTRNIYWKPTLNLVIDAIRVMNRIEMESYGARPIHYSDAKNDLSIYTYLKDVYYQVRFHYEWEMRSNRYEKDRIRKKHDEIFTESIASGGRLPVFLGTSECVAYVEPEKFGSGKGYYDDSGKIIQGIMYHGIDYPFGREKGNGFVRLWNCVMEDGVINFLSPEECTMKQPITLKGNALGGAMHELDAKPLQTIR